MASYRNERRIIQRAARKNGIDPAILWGLYGAESDFGRNKNESSAGAQGPFQFMPGTAAGMGIDPHNFKQAAYGAARYLSQYKSRGVAGMLAAYNAGPNGNPNNPETQAYIPEVQRRARSWSPPKGGGPGAAGAGVAGSAPRAPGAVSGPSAAILEAAQAQPLPQGSEGLTAVLASMMERPSIPPSSAGVAPPSFAASPAMAAGAPQLGGGGGPQRRPDISSLLAAIGGQRGETVQSAPDPALMLTQGAAPAGGRGVARAGGALRAPVRGGRVVVAPSADRAGVSTKPYVRQFVKQISALTGEKLTIGTGTRHNRMTTSGNVSDHWSGDAADIPAAGKNLTRLGQAALVAAGMNPAQARKARGGIYNVNGAQIIFNTTEGGNHWNHLHVNPPDPRKR